VCLGSNLVLSLCITPRAVTKAGTSSSHSALIKAAYDLLTILCLSPKSNSMVDALSQDGAGSENSDLANSTGMQGAAAAAQPVDKDTFHAILKVIIGNLLMNFSGLVPATIPKPMLAIHKSTLQWIISTSAAASAPTGKHPFGASLLVLLQHLCVRVPDKAAYRTTLAVSILTLVNAFPKDLCVAFARFLYRMSRNAKVSFRVFAVEMSMAMLSGSKQYLAEDSSAAAADVDDEVKVSAPASPGAVSMTIPSAGALDATIMTEQARNLLQTLMSRCSDKAVGGVVLASL